MKLTLHNQSTQVDFDAQAEVDWLVNFCAFKDNTNAYTMVDGVLRYNHNTLRHMFNQFTRTFPTGLASLVVVQGTERGFSIRIDDQRVRPGFVDKTADLSWLRDYQQDAVWTCTERTRGVMWLVTGAGKCLGLGTPVMRFNGSVVPVEEIVVGDQLMGPDRKPRTVLSRSWGIGALFDIAPNDGPPWVCNDVHVLTLWDTASAKLVDIPLNECLSKPLEEIAMLWGVRSHSVGSLSIFHFDVRRRGIGPYAGFMLDGDGRFLLGDGTITHNTEIAIGVTRAIRDVKWLFLAPEVRLMAQAADRYEMRTGEVAGRIGDGDWFEGDTFTAATVQTLSARLAADAKKTLEFLDEFTGLLIDEIHTFSAEDSVTVGEHIRNAYWRFGMSGTALDRGDRKDMLAAGITGRIIYYKPPEDLINEGYVALPKVVFYPFEHTIAPRANPVVVYSVNIVRNSRRNQMLAELTAAAVKPALVGVRTAVHGLALVKLLKGMGIRVEFMHGKLTQDQQGRMIDRLRDLTTEVIVATKVLQTGTDIEEIATVVNARGNASTVETLQLTGRGMRMIRDANGKIIKSTVDVIEVFDIAVPQRNPLTNRNNTQKELKWLQNFSDQRVASYKSMGYDVTVLSVTPTTPQQQQQQLQLPAV